MKQSHFQIKWGPLLKNCACLGRARDNVGHDVVQPKDIDSSQPLGFVAKKHVCEAP
jgi:hypothetical protein